MAEIEYVGIKYCGMDHRAVLWRKKSPLKCIACDIMGLHNYIARGAKMKSYYDYIDEITEDELYKGLLGYGLFAEKLPPIFTSESFYNYCISNNPTFAEKGDNMFIMKA